MDVVALTRELLADEDADRALGICADRLEAAGLEVEHREEMGALVAHRGEGGLALSGHLDVVPAGEGWTREPFGGDLEDGCLYGRGASDMRGPVACMIRAVERTEAPVSVVLTTDEETTMDTVRQLVDEDVLSEAPLVVVGEPTGLDVATAGKGVLWVRLTATGAQGHASTPRGEAGRGPSGPERLVEALCELPAEPIRLTHPELGPATAAISGLASDETPFNVLAGRAQARIDCRFPPPGTPEDVEASIRSKLGLPAEGLEVEIAKREPAFVGDDAQAAEMVEVLGQAGLAVSTTSVVFASEAGHWQRVAPTVICGPGSIDRAHGPDEHVTVDELEAGVDAYTRLVEWRGQRA